MTHLLTTVIPSRGAGEGPTILAKGLANHIAFIRLATRESRPHNRAP